MAFTFEWDAAKARLNVRKHRVSFEETATAFEDQFLLTVYDEQHSNTEDRFISVGISDRGRLLTICHTDRGDAIRIISSRLSTRSERKNYEQETGF